MRVAPECGGRRVAAGRCAGAAAVFAVVLLVEASLHAAPFNVGLIVPGGGIGPVKLGMTVSQVRGLWDQLPCEMVAAYSEGRVSRLETNCGVAYQTTEGITVGLDGSRIWWVHGRPDAALPSNFAGTRADWLLYRGPGIGFRVIYAEGGSLIQAISVFKGSGLPAGTRPGLPPVPVPPPIIGD